MNFEQSLSLLNGLACDGSPLIVLILALVAFRRTRDWGFCCWIISSIGTLLEIVLHRTGAYFPDIEHRNALFLVTVVVFTVGACRIIYRYLRFSRVSALPISQNKT